MAPKRPKRIKESTTCDNDPKTGNQKNQISKRKVVADGKRSTQSNCISTLDVAAAALITRKTKLTGERGTGLSSISSSLPASRTTRARLQSRRQVPQSIKKEQKSPKNSSPKVKSIKRDQKAFRRDGTLSEGAANSDDKTSDISDSKPKRKATKKVASVCTECKLSKIIWPFCGLTGNAHVTV